MKEIRFLKAFGEIDEKYIIEAEEYVPKKKQYKKFAASFIALLFISTALIPFIFGSAGMGKDDKKAEDGTDRYPGGRGGYGYIAAYDIEEIIDKNPWNDSYGLTSLPVYKNMAYVDPSGASAYHSDEDLLRIANSTADNLGETIKEYSYDVGNHLTDSEDGIAESKKIYAIDADTANYSISVFGNGSTMIHFADTVSPVPDSAGQDNVSQEEEKEVEINEDTVTEYAKKYSSVTGIDDAVVSVTAEYTYNADAYYTCTAYEYDEDPLQNILNYNFSSAEFSFTEENDLFIISKDDLLSSSEELGTYDIITNEEAVSFLIESGEISSESEISYSTLVYSNSPVDKYFMPYYVYYVQTDLPKDLDFYTDKNLKHYRVHHIPALKDDSFIF